jgi:hypothetical protein
MFGNSKDRFEHLAEKNHWARMQGKLNHASSKTKIAIAAACSKSSEDESMNILVRLLQDDDEAVQFQAIKSLEVCGRSSIKGHLHSLSEHLPQGKENVKQAIREAMAGISKRG